jgi:oxygen-independent coproporphyrinogen-3 oxidase
MASAGGTLARNFQGYTTDLSPALIGFGASAISSLPQGYVQNTVPTAVWRAFVESAKLTPMRGIVLTRGDRIRRHVIEQLMCNLAVDLAAVRKRFALPEDAFLREKSRLATLARNGLVEMDEDAITVAPVHRQAARLAAAAFDTYLEQTEARHAVTA